MWISKDHTIPLAVSLLIPAFGIGVYFLVYWNWSALPDGVLLAEEPLDGEPVFVSERAHNHLRVLTSHGPRVVGSSANEIYAVQFLLETIQAIIEQTDPSNLLTVEVQHASGSYFLDYKDYPITSYYRGVQNVVAALRTRDEHRFSGKYLLLNAHFDSAVSSPGAGDDGTMVVVMLEILRQVATHALNLRHGLIFLFNGCEENTMQGAHGFVTGHPLAANVSAFINLDVAANGGREIMFQSGPNFPFLMENYQRYAKRPYANSLGEEVFQLGLVPSFTDFETLSKVGHWPGLDFALASYGYLYHTMYDAFETISLETLQHIGENLLPLTIGLAGAEELSNIGEHEGGAATFFDFLHWFKLIYTQTVAYIINITLALVALGLIIATIVMMVRREGADLVEVLMECGLTLIVQTLSIAVGAGICILIAVIVDLCGRSMAWFSSTWLLYGLYFVPFIACLALGPNLYIHFRKMTFLHPQGRVLLFLHAQCFIYVALLLTLTIGGVRSAYILLFPIIFHSLATIINVIIKFKLNRWIYVQLACQFIPLVYFCSLTVTVFAVFIPMTGRGDAATNPDIMMALFCALMALLLVAMCLPLIVLIGKIYYFYALLGLMFVATVIVLATPVAFPFREEISPQRNYVFHQQSNFYHQNGTLRRSRQNFFIYPQDRHTPDNLFNDGILHPTKTHPIGSECDEELYCGFPMYINRYHRQREYSYWIEASTPPLFPEPVFLHLTQRQDLSSTTRLFRFTIEGPTLMGFYFSPIKGNRLVAWTFSEQIPPSGTPWNDQPVYYVNYLQAKSREPFEFFIEIECTSGVLSESPVVLVSVVGQYMYHDQYRNEEFKNLLSRMSPYMHTVAYPNYLESWEF
ncbi:endoplasmic reticulum metallopeptidase 1-like [Wyeomyia smithii]|uniref:endoplasmic reticulum metallopeptidase 1-like n=1 Tax=Wyeomyia smithii TaxID=174621 RepID=UPI0024681F5A|nr:endoplasmic reticulum metallopeptidase 1-like [Wyeomyia smithii]